MLKLWNNIAPIIVFCSTGKRAANAKKVLMEKGYTTVLNAGTIFDVVEYL